MIRLHASFLTIGWQWPFRAGDVLRVHQGPTLIAELSEEVLRGIIVHYLAAHELTQRVGAAVKAPTRRPLMAVTAPGATLEQRLGLRAARRQRRRFTAG